MAVDVVDNVLEHEELRPLLEAAEASGTIRRLELTEVLELHELAPLSRALIAQFGELQPEEVWSAAPGLDIRSMQHERLYSRLYRS